jgi:hypothetical protein
MWNSIKDTIKQFCPPKLNKFAYLPSDGAACGSLIDWKGFKFDEFIFENELAQSDYLTVGDFSTL